MNWAKMIVRPERESNTNLAISADGGQTYTPIETIGPVTIRYAQPAPLMLGRAKVKR